MRMAHTNVCKCKGAEDFYDIIWRCCTSFIHRLPYSHFIPSCRCSFFLLGPTAYVVTCQCACVWVSAYLYICNCSNMNLDTCMCMRVYAHCLAKLWNTGISIFVADCECSCIVIHQIGVSYSEMSVLVRSCIRRKWLTKIQQPVHIIEGIVCSSFGITTKITHSKWIIVL